MIIALVSSLLAFLLKPLKEKVQDENSEAHQSYKLTIKLNF